MAALIHLAGRASRTPSDNEGVAGKFRPLLLVSAVSLGCATSWAARQQPTAALELYVVVALLSIQVFGNPLPCNFTAQAWKVGIWYTIFRGVGP